MWMNGALSMSRRLTSKDTTSTISSPASAGGATRSGSPDGPMIAPSGPAPVPVSRFRSRDREKAMPTNDTSGPLFTHSSLSAALQRSLESRLRARWDLSGSPEFALIWKVIDMPSGPPICALRALGRRTSGSASSGWPTPRAEDSESTGAHRKVPDTLTSAARMSPWPTPMATDDRATSGGRGPEKNPSLRIAAGWATPDAAAMNVGADPTKHMARLEGIQGTGIRGNGGG